MSCLKESAFELATGDPTYCEGCKAILNMYSLISEQQEESGKRIWECEFCNFKNFISVEPEEKPKTETVSYIIEAAA
jgi:hypothetical protein